VALLFFGRDRIHVFNLVRDKELGEITSPKVAAVLHAVFEDVNRTTSALHCHSMLSRHVDWPLEVPVLPPLTFLQEDSIVEIECLDRFEVTIEEDATKPSADVYLSRRLPDWAERTIAASAATSARPPEISEIPA